MLIRLQVSKELPTARWIPFAFSQFRFYPDFAMQDRPAHTFPLPHTAGRQTFPLHTHTHPSRPFAVGECEKNVEWRGKEEKKKATGTSWHHPSTLLKGCLHKSPPLTGCFQPRVVSGSRKKVFLSSAPSPALSVFKNNQAYVIVELESRNRSAMLLRSYNTSAVVIVPRG